MEIKAESEAPALKRSHLDTNYSMCIICQEENNIDLVVSLTNCQKVLDSVKECGLYGDSYFPEVNRRLQIVTEEGLGQVKQHGIIYAINRQPIKSLSDPQKKGMSNGKVT